MKLIYYVAVSQDGKIADRTGSVDFLHLAELPSEDYGYRSFYNGIDSLIMGAGTFFAVQAMGQWPYGGKPAVVVSQNSGLQELPAGVRVEAEPVAALRQLYSEGSQRVWLVGGGRLAGTYLQLGLIDEMVLTVVPCFLGDGIPVFSGIGPSMIHLHMTESHSYSNGVVQNVYVRRPRS
jgi:dihydrofolate reductase